MLKHALRILLAFAILEGGARLIFMTNPKYWMFFDDDSCQRILFVRNHQNGSFDFWCDSYDPLRGWKLTPSIRHRLLRDKPLNSNSHGLRGKTEYSLSHPAGKTRICIFGDSFTFGEQVGDADTYSAQLARLLPNAEVLNFGVHGYGQDQMLLYLASEAAAYHPDVVILGFLPMDMERNRLSFWFNPKPRFKLENGDLVLTSSPVPPPQDWVEKEIYRLKIIDLVNTLWSRTPLARQRHRREEVMLTEAILAHFAAKTREMHAIPLFVYMPDRAELVEIQNGQSPAQEKAFLEFCRHMQIDAFSLCPAFRAALLKGYQPGNTYHWGPMRHRIAALAIRDYLLQHGLIPRRATS